jgi:protein ImuA
MAHGVVPFGVTAIDRALPGGGLARGALHEIIGVGGDEEDGALAAAFTAGIAARLAAAGGGLVLWCLARPDLYGPGLAALGLDPARLVLVCAARDADILWAMEEGLRTAGLAAVVGETGVLSAVASRRLQLAAERSGVTAFVLRRWRNGDEAARQRNLPNAAASRWRISALPSAPIRLDAPFVARPPDSFRRVRSSQPTTVMPGLVPGIHAAPMRIVDEEADAHGSSPWAEGPRVKPGHDDFRSPFSTRRRFSHFPRTVWADDSRSDGYATEPGIGHPRWRVELLRCRGGAPGCWEVEIRKGEMADAADALSVAAALADRPAVPDGRAALSPERHRRVG